MDTTPVRRSEIRNETQLDLIDKSDGKDPNEINVVLKEDKKISKRKSKKKIKRDPKSDNSINKTNTKT